MTWLGDLVGEFAISAGTGGVWLAIGAGLALAVGATVPGLWLARRIGLLDRGAPAAETIAVGLAVGLMVAASLIAALGSGGRSAFTPVAVGFAVTVVLAVRRPVVHEPPDDGLVPEQVRRDRRDLATAALGAAAFIVLAAHLYGATMAPSPREGVQPIEFMDEAFYSELGGDLARTGTESTMSPSGFGSVAGAAPQNWYHWGELWLAAGVIKVWPADPILVRHFVVLPVVLLAAAALAGTVVRRLNRTRARGAFLMGFAACLFLSPIPWRSGPFFTDWAVGMFFGITVYGMAAVAVSLAILALTRAPDGRSWTTAAGLGSAMAFVLPAHVVIAALAAVAAAISLALGLIHSFRAGMPWSMAVPPPWRRTATVLFALTCASVGWGWLTGHSVGGTGLSSGVEPFNPAWSQPLLTIGLGAGVFYAIPVGWWIGRRSGTRQVLLYAATAGTVAVAAIAWGLRLGDFNAFHIFFGSLAVFATTAASVATWAVWVRVRSRATRALRVAFALLVSVQLLGGSVLTVLRLQRFGPGNYDPVPLAVIATIHSLPSEARIAYSCRIDEELAYWDPRLLAIGVHGGRPIVPMCFEVDSFGVLVGAQPTLAMSPLFVSAPHLALYPDARTVPSPERVEAFLRANGILYIYADAAHPNKLVPTAQVILDVDGFRVLRLP